MEDTPQLLNLIKATMEAINNASTKAAIEAIKISTGKEPSQDEKNEIFKKVDEITSKTFKEQFKD